MIPLRDTIRPMSGKRPEAILLYLAEEEPKRKKGLRSYVSVVEIAGEFSEFQTPSPEEIGWFRKALRPLRNRGLISRPTILDHPERYVVLTAIGTEWAEIRAGAIRRRLSPLAEAHRIQVERLATNRGPIPFRVVGAACVKLSPRWDQIIAQLVFEGHLERDENAVRLVG